GASGWPASCGTTIVVVARPAGVELGEPIKIRFNPPKWHARAADHAAIPDGEDLRVEQPFTRQLIAEALGLGGKALNLGHAATFRAFLSAASSARSAASIT